MERIRNKNTSFSTDNNTFRLAKSLAVLEDVSLSELVDRALRKELDQLVKKHCQNQQLGKLLLGSSSNQQVVEF